MVYYKEPISKDLTEYSTKSSLSKDLSLSQPLKASSPPYMVRIQDFKGWVTFL